MDRKLKEDMVEGHLAVVTGLCLRDIIEKVLKEENEEEADAPP